MKDEYERKMRSLQAKLAAAGGKGAPARGASDASGSGGGALTLNARTVFAKLSVADFDPETIVGRRRRQALQRAIALALPGIDATAVQISVVRNAAA